MCPYTFTGLTAELFAEARKRAAPLASAGPRAGEVWVSLATEWRAAPATAMPLLIGVDAVAEAAAIVKRAGGELRPLRPAEVDDAMLLYFRAEREGGGRCR